MPTKKRVQFKPYDFSGGLRVLTVWIVYWALSVIKWLLFHCPDFNVERNVCRPVPNFSFRIRILRICILVEFHQVVVEMI